MISDSSRKITRTILTYVAKHVEVVLSNLKDGCMFGFNWLVGFWNAKARFLGNFWDGVYGGWV